MASSSEKRVEDALQRFGDVLVIGLLRSPLHAW